MTTHAIYLGIFSSEWKRTSICGDNPFAGFFISIWVFIVAAGRHFSVSVIAEWAKLARNMGLLLPLCVYAVPFRFIDKQSYTVDRTFASLQIVFKNLSKVLPLIFVIILLKAHF